MGIVRRALPPAEEVVDAESGAVYDLRMLRAPALGGTLLWVFTWVVESWIFRCILAPKLMRDSGLPQVLSDIDLPERPTYVPVILEGLIPPAHEQLELLPQPTAAGRVTAALASLPGWNKGTDTSGRQRRPCVTDFHKAFSTGKATPTEVANNVLRCIAESQAAQPPMHFFAFVDAEDVRQQAALSTARYKAGEPLSALDGVPFAVKDLMDALPCPTGAGTAYLASRRRVVQSSAMADALRSAGALMVGKASTHEIGIGTTGLNVAAGTPRNPYSSAHHTGGSSSGCAALLAAGICPIAIGSDGGGSIRIPSSLCGVVGLKPSFGREGRGGGPALGHTVGVAGPMATCVADLLLMWAAIASAGCHNGAKFGNTPPVPAVPRSLFGGSDRDLPLKGFKFGVYKEWCEDAQPQVITAFYSALGLIQAAGGHVVHVVLPELEQLRVGHLATISTESALSMRPVLRERATRMLLNKDTRINLATAQLFTAADYLQAQRIRTRQTVHHLRVLADVHFIASPSTFCTAPAIPQGAPQGGHSNLPLTGRLMQFVLAANFTGLPAMSQPVAHDATGLPIGFQLIGRPWDEASLLYAASVIEAAVQNNLRLPAISYDVLSST